MIGIFHGGTSNRNGPGKLALNLFKGLDKLNIKYRVNEECDLTGCLTSWGSRFMDLPSDTLVGPNLVVLPTDIPQLWTKFKNVVVPCNWVKSKYKQYGMTKDINFFVWPVGIDTETFSPNKNKKEECLIYFKNGSQKTLESCVSILNDKNIKYRILEYGNYTESEFIEIGKSSKFSVLITSTESQGIAYQELLSMNVPCYCIDKTVWDDRQGHSYPATSVPYFDKSCGIKSSDFSDLDEFLDNIHLYEPRKYILDNLGLEKQAKNYVNILEHCHD